MDNPEKLATYRVNKTETNNLRKTQVNAICVGHHYTQTIFQLYRGGQIYLPNLDWNKNLQIRFC